MDPRFFTKRDALSWAEVEALLIAAGLLKAKVARPASRRFQALKPLQEAGPDDLSFFHNAKYINELARTRAGLVLVPQELAGEGGEVPYLPVRDVHRALALVGQAFLVQTPVQPGVHPSAVVAASAQIDPSAEIGAHVVVDAQAEIGAHTRLQAGVNIASGVRIGASCQIDARVVVSHALIGDRVHIKPGAAIGQRGFGWALSPEGHIAKPQVGRVWIGNDVEIGANTAIDRGSVEDTVIGDGTVIDNLCHIAHNCKIGRFCALAATTAFAGSTTLGDFVIMGGGVAAKGHVHIAEGTVARAWTFIGRNTQPGEVLVGNPARSSTAYQRLLRHWSRIARNAKGD